MKKRKGPPEGMHEDSFFPYNILNNPGRMTKEVFNAYSDWAET